MTFRSDLAFGKRWERIAADLVGGVAEFSEGCVKGWDFQVEGKKYEVKADRLAYKWGSKTMFIEYSCGGVPSGISTTEAEEWFYFMVNPDGSATGFRIPVVQLKMACFGCESKSGGDGYRAKGYIVPVESFRNTSVSVPVPLDPLRIPQELRLQRSRPLPLSPRSSGSRTPDLPNSEEGCPRPEGESPC